MHGVWVLWKMMKEKWRPKPLNSNVVIDFNSPPCLHLPASLAEAFTCESRDTDQPIHLNQRCDDGLLFAVQRTSNNMIYMLYVGYVYKETSELIKPIIKQFQFIYSISVALVASIISMLCSALVGCLSCIFVFMALWVDLSWCCTPLRAHIYIHIFKLKFIQLKIARRSRAALPSLLLDLFIWLNAVFRLRSSVRLVWRKMWTTFGRSLQQQQRMNSKVIWSIKV